MLTLLGQSAACSSSLREGCDSDSLVTNYSKDGDIKCYMKTDCLEFYLEKLLAKMNSLKKAISKCECTVQILLTRFSPG